MSVIARLLQLIAKRIVGRHQATRPTAQDLPEHRGALDIAPQLEDTERVPDAEGTTDPSEGRDSQPDVGPDGSDESTELAASASPALAAEVRATSPPVEASEDTRAPHVVDGDAQPLPAPSPIDDQDAATSAIDAHDETSLSPPSQYPVRTLDRPTRAGEPTPEAPAWPRAPATPSRSSALPARYKAWSRALAAYLLGRPSGSRIYLTVTPQVLAAAWADEFQEAALSGEAATDFAAAVSDAYTSHALNEPDGLWTFSAEGPEHRPSSIGFLALSVLAAYDMHTDEEAGPNAFYVRLADLLEVEMVGGHPRGFSTRDFEGLWRQLHHWTEQTGPLALAMPIEQTVRRFLALPLTHAPLRKMDVQKLPAFFAWAGYEAGSRVDREFLGRDLVAWQRSRSPLSGPGAAALADERLEAVTAQAASELEAWDGRFESSAGVRSTSIQLQLDIVRRQPQMQFLARRPTDFPEVFNDGSHVFEAGEEGWYEPMPVPAYAGGELAAGFSWSMRFGPGAVELRRARANAIALVPTREMTGFVSRRGLAGGLRCAVLCRSNLVETAQEYLNSIAQRPCQPVHDNSLPEGWALFPNVVPIRHQNVPAGLEALEVSFAVEIVPVGGLRLGVSRWLEGAAPTVLISGERDGLFAQVDGHDVSLLDDGTVDDGGRLARSGRHIIEAGAARRLVEVVEPELNVWECVGLVEKSPGRVVALPAGSDWTIIGARIGEVVRPDLVTDRGILARSTTFEPHWALATGPDRRSTVLRVSKTSSHPAAGATAGVELTAAQSRTLDELGGTQRGAKVVGIAGVLMDGAPESAVLVPIVRYADGSLHVLTGAGVLVDAADPAVVLQPDSPVLDWASAIYRVGETPSALGTTQGSDGEAELYDLWTAYYETALQFEPLLRRLPS